MLTGSLSKVAMHVVHVWESGMDSIFWKYIVSVYSLLRCFFFSLPDSLGFPVCFFHSCSRVFVASSLFFHGTCKFPSVQTRVMSAAFSC